MSTTFTEQALKAIRGAETKWPQFFRETYPYDCIVDLTKPESFHDLWSVGIAVAKQCTNGCAIELKSKESESLCELGLIARRGKTPTEAVVKVVRAALALGESQ